MVSCRLGNQVGEARALLAIGVAGGAANDLHDLGQAAAVANGQRVFAPDPVKALLGHAQGNDDVHMVAVVLLRRVFQRRQDARAPGSVAVVHQVGHLQGAAVRRQYQMKTGGGVDAFPLAQAVHDLIDLQLLVFEAFAGVDVGDVDDGFERRVQHLGHRIHILAGVEKVANVQRLEPLVAVELLVVGVTHGLEPGLVCRTEHRLAVAPEIRARHGHHMHLVPRHEGAQLAAQHVTRVAGDVVKLVDGNQSVVKSVDAKRLHRKTKGGVGTDQHLVAAGQKLAHGIHFGLGNARLVYAGCVAQVPLRRHLPVPPKALLAQQLIGKARTNGALRHHHDGLLQALVVQLVQRNKHQCSRLARGRGRLDQQILLAAPGVGALLHGAHAQRVGLG